MDQTKGAGSNNGMGLVPVYGAGPPVESGYGTGQTPVIQEGSVELRQHLGLLRARFWTILACAVVVFTLVAVRTFRATPTYEASARLLVERRLPQLTPLDGVQERRDDGYLGTEVNLITSRAVLEEALKRAGSAYQSLLGVPLEEVLAIPIPPRPTSSTRGSGWC